MDEITGSPPLARGSDPVTSHEAAGSFDATVLERKVLDYIRLCGVTGCIGDDVVHALSQYGGVQTLSPRYAPLVRKGFIHRWGDKRIGKSGRSQLVMRSMRNEP